MSVPGVAYDPNDTTQLSFLAALGLGESGSANGYSTGYGGVSTSGAPTDQYGFPTWGGSSTAAGPTHAAGEFQFQPSTWDAIASQFGLNFQNPQDQNAGAWYTAESTYYSATGGDLETALKSGNYASVQQALESVWPSVNGNQSSPQGLAYALANGQGGSISTDPTNTGQTSSGSNPVGTFGGAIAGALVQPALLVVGAVIVLVALWQLLSSTTGAVPGPVDTARAVGRAGASAAHDAAVAALA